MLVRTLPSLPITTHLRTISEGVENSRLAVLQAPPGSGKTTLLPIFLATEPWLQGKKVVVLQPRRLAARGVAQRMAELCNEPVGDAVGYQMRMDRRVSARTRVEIITEGLLTRRILSDPSLPDIGLIIFDEFHERSVHADVGLSLTHEIMHALRDDLRVLVMSATLGSGLESPILRKAWRYQCDAEPHKLTIHYSHPEPRIPLWQVTARAIRIALSQHPGDVLAFLPGVWEIERCYTALVETEMKSVIHVLYGDLPYEQQQRALTPDPHGRRKIILATPIAETSLTIDGVRVVVDAGLHKVARSDEMGIISLETERITRDSADQRAGRAARQDEGVCIRLWSEAEHQTLRQTREPEVARLDLSQTILELAAWGVREPKTFCWITPPPHGSLERATSSLIALGAITCEGTLTERGRAMVELGTHPRLGVICLEGASSDLRDVAAALVTVLEERPHLRSKLHSVDIEPYLSALTDSRLGSARGRPLDQVYMRWSRRIHALSVPLQSPRLSASDFCAYLLAAAFPDRIARRRPDSRNRYLLAAGIGVALPERDPLIDNEFLIIPELQRHGDDSRASLACALNPRLFDGALSHLVERSSTRFFNEERGVLEQRTLHRVGSITLKEGPLEPVPESEISVALVEFLATPAGFTRLEFPAWFISLQKRLAWLQREHTIGDLPDLSDLALRGSLREWLAPFLKGACALHGVSKETLDAALSGLISWELRTMVNREAPETFVLPNGRSRAIDYTPEGAVLGATIQELFGLRDTPTIGTTRVPLLLHILSPARRPMQVTRDLANFWRSGYQEVRKELRGRYPKHRWPEDPSSDPATRSPTTQPHKRGS